MEMKKGIIFTYDAILAIGIAIVLLSGIMLAGYIGKSDGKTRAMMYTKSADNSDNSFLLGLTPDDSPIADKANCTEVLEYKNGYDAEVKVKTCSELG